MKKNKNFKHSEGFTLIELTIAIVIISFFVAGFFTILTVYLKHKIQEEMDNKIENIQGAIVDYIEEGGSAHYPCPSSRTVNIGEATNCAAPVALGCADGICVAADHGLEVRIGIVPYAELGLPKEAVIDPYNNFFTYAVTEDLAHPAGAPQ